MILLPPIRSGIRFKVFYTTNRPLLNLKEFFECMSQGFGNIPSPNPYGPGGHNGLDLVYEDDTSVYAMHSGVAKYAEDRDQSGALKGYGKYFTVTGSGFKSVYAHLKQRVAVDGLVKAGDLLGQGDSTGFSTGPHLHITVKLVDDNGNVLNRDNGHDGAVDPTKYLANTMFELWQVSGSKEVWLVRDGKRTHLYNAAALTLISDFGSIKQVSQTEMDKLADTGLELASLVKE